MNTSAPPRKTRARKPSHFGSYRKVSPAGSAVESFASIGSIGGSMGNGIARKLINNLRRSMSPGDTTRSEASAMTARPQRDQDQSDSDDFRGASMSFLEHLDELRKRLIVSCVAIGVGMLVAFAFVQRLVDFIVTPILKALPPGSSLVSIRPGETFSFYLNVSFI